MSQPQPVRETKAELTRRLSDIGATEGNVDMKDTVPQRVDNKGTKIEDQAGTGQQDSLGG